MSKEESFLKSFGVISQPNMFTVDHSDATVSAVYLTKEGKGDDILATIKDDILEVVVHYRPMYGFPYAKTYSFNTLRSMAVFINRALIANEFRSRADVRPCKVDYDQETSLYTVVVSFTSKEFVFNEYGFIYVKGKFETWFGDVTASFKDEGMEDSVPTNLSSVFSELVTMSSGVSFDPEDVDTQ